MAKRRMSKKRRNEALAKDIRNWLLDHEMWIDTCIYFNGKAYSTHDKKEDRFYYNDRDHLIELENEDPRDYFEYVNSDHILSMSFEGPLYDVLNAYVPGWTRLEAEFQKLFEKYGLYYEMGNAWNLTCCEM